eukprot:2320549-Rhodomonas_salina.2
MSNKGGLPSNKGGLLGHGTCLPTAALTSGGAMSQRAMPSEGEMEKGKAMRRRVAEGAATRRCAVSAAGEDTQKSDPMHTWIGETRSVRALRARRTGESIGEPGRCVCGGSEHRRVRRRGGGGVRDARELAWEC